MKNHPLRTVIVLIGAGWGKRGARINTISPGIIITPLANDELNGPRGPGYRRMMELCAAGRAGTPDEVGTVGALLMGPDGAFITGSDFLMDGGVTAAYWFGELAPPGTAELDRLQDNYGAVSAELSPEDARELESAASKIKVQGARYPENLPKLVGR